MATYKIHPGIGVARLGNSETAFYLAPENPAGAPLDCDAFGNPLYGPDGITPVPVTAYKDAEGKVKRQGARFQIYVYDEESPEGRPLKLGDPIEGGGNHGVLTDIQWRVYLANKKASWYEFEQTEGEHGYADDHPRRNASVTDRDRLVIDPGPRIVDSTHNRRARFDRDGANGYATTFPPKDTQPFSIDTLGELVTDDQGRLIVLGGHGRSGSELSGPGQPRIDDYANTDGWYDDTSDGPVMARLTMYSSQVGQPRYIDVEYPAWAVVGYPRFAPQILDMVTMDEVLEDLFIREFATDTSLYGQLGAYDPPAVIPFRDEGALLHWQAGRLAWNRAYRPWFFRDIWPILFRPDEFRYLTNILQQSNYPHDQARRGTFDPYKLCIAPGSADKVRNELAVSAEAEAKVEGAGEIDSVTATTAHLRRDAAQGEAIIDTQRRPTVPHIEDPYSPMRRFLFDLLRRGGEENAFHLVDRVGSRIHDLPLMPLLAGDNPISNVAPSKFLKLTDTQLFLLSQWADGCFIDDMAEGWLPANYSPFLPYPQTPPATARALDRGVLSNVLGGAFCPGGELGWIMRNPSIYWDAYRIKADRSVSDFLQSAAQANQFHNTVKADYTFSVENTLNQKTDFQVGLQPGDLTKYSALPWQSDFNECTTQTINVTYADWNQINPASGNNTRLNNEQKVWETLWWPAHRPLQSYELTSPPDATQAFTWTTWSRGVQQTSAGDLKMVTEWSKLGFIVRNPYATNLLMPADMLDAQNTPKYVSIERS